MDCGKDSGSGLFRTAGGLTGVDDGMGKDYWFPARRHGYGWGLPVKWQGWLAMALFLLHQAGALVAFPPARDPGTFVAVTLFGALALMLVCVAQGRAAGQTGVAAALTHFPAGPGLATLIDRPHCGIALPVLVQRDLHDAFPPAGYGGGFECSSARRGG